MKTQKVEKEYKCQSKKDQSQFINDYGIKVNIPAGYLLGSKFSPYDIDLCLKCTYVLYDLDDDESSTQVHDG